jgi:hypothetical protein
MNKEIERARSAPCFYPASLLSYRRLGDVRNLRCAAVWWAPSGAGRHQVGSMTSRRQQ